MSGAVRLLLPLLGALICAPAAAQDSRLALDEDFDRTEVVIVTRGGARHDFELYLADTPARREQGLMFVEALAPDEGMLFLFDPPRPVSMWMKNTLVSLDMLFVRRDGIITNMAVNTVPQTLSHHRSAGAATAVVELAAGTAARLGILPGDRVEHPWFSR